MGGMGKWWSSPPSPVCATALSPLPLSLSVSGSRPLLFRGPDTGRLKPAISDHNYFIVAHPFPALPYHWMLTISLSVLSSPPHPLSPSGSGPLLLCQPDSARLQPAIPDPQHPSFLVSITHCSTAERSCSSRPCLALYPCQVLVPSSFVGLILEDCNLPFPDHGHVILADPSPILFYRIASNEVRCLVDIPAGRRMPSVASGDMAAYLTTHVLPQVGEEGMQEEGKDVCSSRVCLLLKVPPPHPHPPPLPVSNPLVVLDQYYW